MRSSTENGKKGYKIGRFLAVLAILLPIVTILTALLMGPLLDFFFPDLPGEYRTLREKTVTLSRLDYWERGGAHWILHTKDGESFEVRDSFHQGELARRLKKGDSVTVRYTRNWHGWKNAEELLLKGETVWKKGENHFPPDEEDPKRTMMAFALYGAAFLPLGLILFATMFMEIKKIKQSKNPKREPAGQDGAESGPEGERREKGA